MTTTQPVLLFGMPRSGTTWIGKIFDSSPDTLYRHEPDSWGTLNAIPMFPNMHNQDAYREVVMNFLLDLHNARKTKVAGSLPIFQKRNEGKLAYYIRQVGVMGVKALSNYTGELNIPGLLDPTHGLCPIWKSIESTGRLGLILRIAPETRAIHILRHPCGFVSSVLQGEQKNKFEGGKDSEDFGMFAKLCELPGAHRRSLSVDAFKAMQPAQRLAWRWLLVNEKAMEDCAGLVNYRPINYDQVCTQPEQEARAMYAFAGLDWNAQTQGFISASIGVENSAYYSVFKDPLKAANKWQKELSAEQIKQVIEIVQDTGPGQMFMA